MRIFRVTFERTQQGFAEIEANDFADAREKAFGLQGFEIDWHPIDRLSIEVVDVDEVCPDDDD